MRQYSGFITHWTSAATIFYMQMSNEQNVNFNILSQEENQRVVGLQSLLNL